jgi:hypothetical protein
MFASMLPENQRAWSNTAATIRPHVTCSMAFAMPEARRAHRKAF